MERARIDRCERVAAGSRCPDAAEALSRRTACADTAMMADTAMTTPTCGLMRARGLGMLRTDMSRP